MNELTKQEGTKFCPHCKEQKSVGDFWKDKHTKDGFCCQCKTCQKEVKYKNKDKLIQKHKQYQLKNPIDGKVCSACMVKRDISEFCKNSAYKDGRDCKCKICQQESRDKNKEKLIQEHKKQQLENPIDKKVCSCCKQEKNIADFDKRKRNKDGFCKKCKICWQENKKKNKERLLQEHLKYQEGNPIDKKVCSKCGEEKSVNEFWKKRTSKDGFSARCKSCIKETKTKNREKLFQEHKKYQLENPIDKKVCTCCKEEKLVSEFSKDKNSKDGLSFQCK